MISYLVFFSRRRRHTRCALVTGVQTCALPISADRAWAIMLSNHITDLARRALTHLHAGTTDQAPQTMRLPVDAYLGPERFRHEFDAIFLRRPQALMLTVELPEPGDYVARTMLGKRSEEHTSELQSLMRISYA